MSHADSEDAELARRCAKGDERAMRCVFELHEARIRAFAQGMLGSEQDAEEISASTLLRFYKTAGRFRGDCTLKSFLTRIAMNLARDHLRKRKVRTVPMGPSVRSLSNGHPAAERIHEAMAKLGADDREILALYYLEETTYEELMELLGVSYDVVRTRLVRARQKLRTILEEKNGRS